MKIRLPGRKAPIIVLDNNEIDPAAEYTRQWLMAEIIRDDPSYTPAMAAQLCRQAGREALAGGF